MSGTAGGLGADLDPLSRIGSWLRPKEIEPVSLPPMSIINRRNAILGWLTWVGAKTVMKRKARQALPGTVEGTKRPNKGAIAAGLAAIGGVLWFWRKKSSDDAEPAPPAGE
jgi:hypothetical protein